MAWTNTRLNLHYHWKTVLFWIIGMGVLAAVMVGMMQTPTHAWVKDHQPFPDGEAPVVVHRFCLSRTCDTFPQSVWQREIRAALAQWNAAGANFHFSERAARPTDDPCDTNGAVVVILYKSGDHCSRDQRVFDQIAGLN